jgi:hypothetical protein
MHRKHIVRGTVWCSEGGGDHISSDWFSVHGPGHAGSAPSRFSCVALLLLLQLKLNWFQTINQAARRFWAKTV